MRTAADIERVNARLSEIGAASRSVAATIAAAPHASVRELPRISVDLHSTMPGRPQPSPAAPAKVGRDLEVISQLGEGGMGRVLLARQHSLDREVAIKTLHADATDHERAALIAEGAITGHLEHPAIVPVHALGLDGEGRPVLVMKRVEGVEWSELIDGDAPLSRHLEILIQVCHALELAHSRQIVHRDIKPQNVLIGRYGDVYLCDWGLAVRIDRAWDPQPLCGTPGYMAPEMVLGEAVDARTDVYLLGATLHHVLTGLPRNGGEDARAATLASLDAGPIAYPDTVPEELATLANHATAREPADRPAGVAVFRAALVAHVQHGSSLALGRSATARVEELRRLVEAGVHDEASQRAFDRLSVEARFALDQALAQWPDNALARDASGALDQLLAARQARVAELERLAHQLDPDALGQLRTVAFGALAVVGLALAALGFVRYPEIPAPERMFQQSLLPLGALVVVIAVLHRRAFGTLFNRRLTLCGLALLGGVTLSRALAVHAGESTPSMLLHDALYCAGILALGATYLFRWMAVAAVLMLATAITCATSPPHAHLAFSLAGGLAFVIAAIGSRMRA